MKVWYANVPYSKWKNEEKKKKGMVNRRGGEEMRKCCVVVVALEGGARCHRQSTNKCTPSRLLPPAPNWVPSLLACNLQVNKRKLGDKTHHVGYFSAISSVLVDVCGKGFEDGVENF